MAIVRVGKGNESINLNCLPYYYIQSVTPEVAEGEETNTYNELRAEGNNVMYVLYTSSNYDYVYYLFRQISMLSNSVSYIDLTDGSDSFTFLNENDYTTLQNNLRFSND